LSGPWMLLGKETMKQGNYEYEAPIEAKSA
jgi:hypothetical protein